MSSLYDNLLNNLQINTTINPFEPSTESVSAPTAIPTTSPTSIIESKNNSPLEKLPLFSIENFTSKLKKKSHQTNKSYHNNSYNINAYDISSQCARIPFFRIKDYPVKDYSSSWLPLAMRGHIGNSVHDFLQSVDDVFSEIEVCLKIPSLQISVRADALINDDVLVEIKSCTYADYDSIIKSNAPRNSDFYQAVFYKHLLENHLEEIKQQQPSRNGALPKFDQYNIKYIQLIYVCHELISSDSSTLNEDLKFSKELKKKLDSRRNPFWFITTLSVDLSKINIKIYENYLLEKYNTIKTAIDSNVIIPMDNKFIDTKGCYFCVYKQTCEKYR